MIYSNKYNNNNNGQDQRRKWCVLSVGGVSERENERDGENERL